jgi:DNA (cytosine-5)-methyltransferase 1
MAVVVRALRPRYVVVENVDALVRDSAAFGWLLGDLASLGFDARWGLLSACALGAPHTRRRLFLVAHPHRVDGPVRMGDRSGLPALQPGHLRAGAWADPGGLVAAERRSRRVAHGVPDRMEPARVRALGNAVVPAVAEHIGRLITLAEQEDAR